MKRDEVRWTCDRCQVERMTLTPTRLPSEWKEIEHPLTGKQHICGECVSSLYEWWTAGATVPVAS